MTILIERALNYKIN